LQEPFAWVVAAYDEVIALSAESDATKQRLSRLDEIHGAFDQASRAFGVVVAQRDRKIEEHYRLVIDLRQQLASVERELTATKAKLTRRTEEAKRYRADHETLRAEGRRMTDVKDENTGSPNVYAKNWDRYVLNNFQRLKARNPHLKWPGDEWGNESQWKSLFERMIASHFPHGMSYALEIGPGSGKYTILTLDRFPAVKVIGCDVSAVYLEVMKERCASYIADGRLLPELITPSETALTDATRKHGLIGKLDAVISIDAMVHADLHYLASYWREAGQLLRSGGKIVMTVADATNELGITKLLNDIATYFRDPSMIGKFEWISPEIVCAVLNRLGFDVQPYRLHRDLGFVATKR
jgi:SAM-dependent methyltransferase